MMRFLEGLAFIGLAAGAHLGVWALSPAVTGTDAAGGKGHAVTAAQAATPEQMRLVAAWDRPPEVEPAPTPVALPTPTAPNAPALPQQDARPTPETARPAAPALQSPRSDPPTPDSSPPPPMSAPREILRPKERPATLPSRPAPRDLAASGSARQEIAGKQGASKTQSQTTERANALRAQWGAAIYAKVKRNLIAPRDLKEDGTAKLTLKVAATGRLQTVSLIRSSGSPALDRAALQAIKRAGRFDKAPAGLTGDSHDFSLSLTFTR
jgi:protein TonB